MSVGGGMDWGRRNEGMAWLSATVRTLGRLKATLLNPRRGGGGEYSLII